MGKPISRQQEVSQICYFPAFPGGRAVFLAEARNRKEMRQVQELFDMVGQLAEVVPISHGTVMSYAVQVHDDTSLFGKIEWLLKTQFTFSLVERSFSEVTLQLVHSLCSESETQFVELPHCGICKSVDPFPTRATVEVAGQENPLHLAYCARCAAQHAEEEPAQLIRGLVRRDLRRFKVAAAAPVTLMPEMVDERPEQDNETIAIAV
jgi:hypothetical protein